MEELILKQIFIAPQRVWQLTLYLGDKVLSSIDVADEIISSEEGQLMVDNMIAPYRFNPDDEDDV